ncbi:MAG TPA: PQQ-binding-like beta-propeller repeat protein [Tepidisphaeraceae bacterium]|nr:PQQ-binding-like beta-propeller repeat protein [Tepidisphaeraceae bacterium]
MPIRTRPVAQCLRMLTRTAYAAAAAAMLMLSPPSRAAFAPPDETFALANQWPVLQLEVQQGNYSDAAARLRGLWSGNADGLVKTEDGGVVSLRAWLAALPAEQRSAVAEAYDRLVSAEAAAALRAAAGDPAATPRTFHAIARRYPGGTTAAGNAFATAARRAAQWGDARSARDLYAVAAASPAVTIDPADLKPIDAALAANTYVAGQPMLAAWYGGGDGAFGSDKPLPLASGDTTFVAGRAGVTAVRGAAVVWAPAPDLNPPDGASAAKATAGERGELLAPAAVVGMGAAQVIVVRATDPADGSTRLRGLRATDGRVLWTTDGDDALRDVVLLSSPAVAGRYAYVLGGRFALRQGELLVCCVDAMTGRSAWVTNVGTIDDPRAAVRPDQATALPFVAAQAPPAVAGDAVYVAAGGGHVAAVDRFDGAVRWVRPYAVPAADPDRLRDYMSKRGRDAKARPPVPTAALARWSATPAVVGRVVVAAPQDTAAVLAFAADDGKPLWQKDDLAVGTLVGAAGGVAVFADEAKVTAVDPKAGGVAWSTPLAPVGPPVVAGDRVLVPVNNGVVALAAATGQATTAGPKPPAFDPATAPLPVQGALRGVGVFDALVVAGKGPRAAPAPGAKLVVREALYGDFDSGRTVDVTDKVQAMVKYDALTVTPSNDQFTDPASGAVKKLKVVYTYAGREQTATVDEGQQLVVAPR